MSVFLTILRALASTSDSGICGISNWVAEFPAGNFFDVRTSLKRMRSVETQQLQILTLGLQVRKCIDYSAPSCH
jgi:hypothetical protein